MATRMVTREENVELKDLRTELLPVLASELSRLSHEGAWNSGKDGDKIYLDTFIKPLVALVKRSLKLESVNPVEVFMEVKNILEDSAIHVRVAGANDSVLIIEIIFPKPEPGKPAISSLPTAAKLRSVDELLGPKYED